MTNRRQLITGLISLIAAPAIVRASSLMPIKTMVPIWQVGDLDHDLSRVYIGSGQWIDMWADAWALVDDVRVLVG